MPILSNRQLDLSSITGSLLGTASFALTALTASFALNVDSSRITQGNVTASVGDGNFIFLVQSQSQNVLSIDQQAALVLSSSASTPFLIKNHLGDSVLEVSQSGVVIVTTHSVELTTSAPNGGIYFTSNSFFVGLD